MTSWTEYAAEARARGALAHELYMVLSTPAGDPAKVKETLPAHLTYQAELEARGALFLAGPVSDETGELMQGNGSHYLPCGVVRRRPRLGRSRSPAAQRHGQGAKEHSARRAFQVMKINLGGNT